ncbi:trypsin-like peptidase domain-containing protein [Streptomyces albogriseolus]|uniref:trypsin-like peptidase domain-containing protein n=1 Tax=Streptomyces TaxID=1883 RepID=UPI002A752024|nr:trypsin-like peptidase domain-containing protein [Streptomyces sp. CL7]WPP31877.1 trypsin-like peptidase domain-containing protein [Streptomyces sp. CL7]
MNEGKPGTPGASEGPDGDFELARPNGTGSPGTGPDGDYELRRPLDAVAAPPSTDGTPGAGAAADPGRLGGTPGAEPTPAGLDAGTAIGGAHPADTGAEHITGVETVEHGAPAAPAPGAEPPASGHSGPAPAPGAEAPASGPTHPAPAHGAHVPAQPRPLHDPDPYSTPPYGEPGPWAPAPPVQHPAATPAHGVAVGAPEAVSAAPVAQEAPAADPWARYDPWAAPAVAPLQQADPVEEDVKRRRGRRRRTLIGGALIIALVSGVTGGVVGVQLERSGGIGAVELPQAGVEAPDRDPDSVAGIAAQALPSVVTLHVSGGGRAGTGTGFVLDDRGHILTNDHVVEPAGENGDITVTFHSGDTAEATVVGRDSGYDLAVVRVKGVRGLTPLPLGNSDNVQVGDPVVAIGAPFDLAGTVTSGIISARERPITAGGEKGDGSDVSYVDALQTDAPINPGNSGGPLLDGKGRVIGINSAIRSADGGLDPEGGQSGSIGLGFAIPINQGKRVAEELIETGEATHPVIGITLDMEYSGDGARVAAEGGDGGPPVSTGGPGAKAGIRPGDVITEVDGRPVRSGEELIVKTRAHRPGDRLELTLERDGEERTVSLVLGSSGGG